MPVLAERAGVGAGTIYCYFASKDALVNALFRRWKAEMTDVVSGHIPPGVGSREEFSHWCPGQRTGPIRAGLPEVLIALVLGAFTGLFKSASIHDLPLTRATLDA